GGGSDGCPGGLDDGARARRRPGDPGRGGTRGERGARDAPAARGRGGRMGGREPPSGMRLGRGGASGGDGLGGGALPEPFLPPGGARERARTARGTERDGSELAEAVRR